MPVVPAAGYPTGPEAPQPVPLSPPEDYLRVQATPEAFGAQVGQSMSALGRVLTTSADEFAQVANARQELHNNVVSDKAINDFNDKANNLLYGDPNAPPGSPEAKGYYGLRGQDAIDAYPKMRAALQTSREQMRGQLENPMQQLNFDKETRRQMSLEMGRAGIHYDQQYDVFQTETNKAGATLADQKMSRAALINDDAAFTEAVKEKMDWEFKQLQADGRDKNPQSVWAMQGQVRTDAVKRRLEGYVGQGNVEGVIHILNQESGPDGALSAQEAEHYQKYVDETKAAAAGNRAVRPSSGGGGGPAPRDTGQSGNEAELHNWGGLRRPGVPAAGPQAGGFQSFESDEEGVRAIAWQLDRYASGATTGTPLTTLRGIVTTWAPPSENDTPKLIANAAKIVGVDPDAPLALNNPDIKAKLVEAIIRNEQNGQLPIPGGQELIRRAVATPPPSGVPPRGAPTPAAAGISWNPAAKPAPGSAVDQITKFAVDNAAPGGPSPVTGLREDFAQRILTMTEAMPPEIRAKFTIGSAYRSQAREEEVYATQHPSQAVPQNSAHKYGVGADIGDNSDVINWITNHPEFGLGFPLAAQHGEANHMEMVGAVRVAGAGQMASAAPTTMTDARPAGAPKVEPTTFMGMPAFLVDGVPYRFYEQPSPGSWAPAQSGVKGTPEAAAAAEKAAKAAKPQTVSEGGIIHNPKTGEYLQNVGGKLVRYMPPGV